MQSVAGCGSFLAGARPLQQSKMPACTLPGLPLRLAPARPAGEHRRSLICQAARRDEDSVAVRERTDIAAVSEPAGFVSTYLQPVFSLPSLVPVALGAGGAFALTGDVSAVALGAAVGGAVRAAQLALLQQTVPFTNRRHTLLLPVGVELQMGDAIFHKQLAEMERAGKVLPESHSDYKLVNRIAERIINAVEQGRGGGFQNHIPKFQWEVVVVEDKTPNAFVLPGGKIVVFTSLIKLMDRDEDLLAAVIGHEVAHALARHSTEKMTLGLYVTVAANLIFLALNVWQRRQQGGGQQPQQRGGGGQQQQWPGQRGPLPGQGRGGFPGGFPQQQRGGWPGGNLPRGIPVGYDGPGVDVRSAAYGMPPGYGMPRQPMGLGGRPRPGWGRPQGFNLLNPQLVSVFTNLFLQMPFSRRAEAEADLIGMKLMALGGYNARKAPETFRRLATMEPGKMKGVAGSDTARMVLQVNCTHPRSENRVKMLEEELAMMDQHGDVALDRVMHKIPYWML